MGEPAAGTVIQSVPAGDWPLLYHFTCDLWFGKLNSDQPLHSELLLAIKPCHVLSSLWSPFNF